MFNHPKLATLSAALLIALGGFTAGWAAGGSAFASTLNTGLVAALNSVGQNLFGTAVFSASAPPDPVLPADPMRLDFGDNSLLPITLNVFWPPDPVQPVDPCRSYLQVAIADGVAVVKYDPSAAPAGFSTDIQSVDLSNVYPATSQCPAPACTGDFCTD